MESNRGLVGAARDAFDLFVVHAAEDADFVRGYLLPTLNLPRSRVLLVDELTPGGYLVAEIAASVARSRYTVAVLSPAYLEDRWAMFGEQLASYASVEDVHVIPLQLTDCELPLQLRARVSLDFTDRAGWEAQAARLRTLLHTTAPATEQLPCPYPGMRPFAETEAGRFFGRDQEIDELIGRLDHGEREIYVVGPSGSGKSSLVRAGLLHALDTGASRLERSFAVRTMRPGDRPSDRLAKALEGELAAPAATLAALLARHPPAERVLVFIDQFEELFTVTGADERQRFIATLRALRGEPRCYLLLALRADFFGALMDSELWPDLAGRISPFTVAPLRGPALARAIREPAQQAGVHLEARLCDRLVADAAAEPGALPLVQEMLRILWDKRRRRLLGLAEYQALDDGGRGLDAAIAAHANATMRMLTVAQQAIARRVLFRLVSFGEGRADTRRQQPVKALRTAADDDAELTCVLHHLVDRRLITVDGAEGADDAVADLSHEALIKAWPARRAGAREWMAARRADEQRRRRLEAKVAEWIERGRGAASLLDAVELAEATHWMQGDAARDLGYGPELPALVAASRSELERVAHEAQKARRFAAMTYQEQGRALLFEGRPMRALPYLVAARSEAIESPVLQTLFAQASRNLPLVTFVGHGSSVRKAAFSPDGTRVVTASWDNTARVWNASTGRPVTPPLAHHGAVWAAGFSPDGTRVVTASADQTARVWNASTGRPVTPPLAHQATVYAAAFCPGGTHVVTASADHTARIWDAATGLPAAPPLDHHDAVHAAAFSPDGLRVVTAGADGTARVWDAATAEPVTWPLKHRGVVRTAAFSPDGTRVVTAGDDKAARVWDAATGRQVTPRLEHRRDVLGATFSPDGTRVVTASSDKTARVWDVSTGQPVAPPLEHHEGVSAAAFSPDGTRVLTASWDNTARVWDAVTGAPVTPPLEHQEGVSAAAFSPDGRRVLTACFDRMARVWDASTEHHVMPPLAHDGEVYAAAFSPDGTRVVTASFDGTARLWDAWTGRPVTPPLRHHGFVFTAELSPDGARVVTASYDQTARVWDAWTGAPVTPLLVHRGAVWTAAFSPDSTRVITASWDNTAQIWDAVTGRPVTRPLEHHGPVHAAAFSPDGTRAVTASRDRTAQIWDAATGAPVTVAFEHHDMVATAAFSPDGTRVVTASFDTTARVWDAVTGAPLTPPLEHQCDVLGAAFSPDGTRVVTASRDKTARVWDAATGKPVTPPLEHRCDAHSAAFSADGTRVITASRDGTAQVWDAATGKSVTPPLVHPHHVYAAAFSPDGARVVTAGRDGTARIWSLPLATGSLEDWRLLARCSPFALVDNALTPNPEPTQRVPAGLRPSRGGERRRPPSFADAIAPHRQISRIGIEVVNDNATGEPEPAGRVSRSR
jgi:WD40 repeat protein